MRRSNKTSLSEDVAMIPTGLSLPVHDRREQLIPTGLSLPVYDRREQLIHTGLSLAVYDRWEQLILKRA